MKNSSTNLKSRIAILGMAGSGKTTVCDHLELCGYKKILVGKLAGDFIYSNENDKIFYDRAVLQEAGNRIVYNGLCNKFGDYLIECASYFDNAVFDGLRLADTLSFMKLRSEIISIYVDCDYENMVNRIVNRDCVSKEEAVNILSLPIETCVKDAKQICDYVYKNTCGIDEMLSNIDKYLLSRGVRLDKFIA